jgi:hypothetical protein
MKYTDVVEILGSEGEVINEGNIPGGKTVIYKWNGASGTLFKGCISRW